MVHARGWWLATRSGIRLPYLGAVAFGHCSIDILNSAVAIVLTALVGRFDLSNSQLAWGITVYFVVSSIPMPLFGILADRWNGRWLSQLGLLWVMVFFFFIPFAPTYMALMMLLIIAAPGSAAFHASATRTASMSGGQTHTGISTSVFFFLGQIGLSTGPVIAGVIIKTFGIAGVSYMPLVLLPMCVIMQWVLHKPMPAGSPSTPGSRAAAPAKAALVIVPLVFVLYVVARSATMQNFMSLLPKYFADVGFDSATYGTRAGALVLGGSLGTLAGGFLDAYVNRRWIMVLSLWLSIPFLWLMLNQHGLSYYLSALVAGFITNTSHTVIVVQAQAMLPKREGLASGLVLGVMFASGAIMTGVAGFIADLWSLSGVMYTLAVLPLLAGALLFWPAPRPKGTELLPQVPEVA